MGGGHVLLRDRLIWVAVSLVLTSMAASLWGQQAAVAALGAGAVAFYAAIAAARGRCLGSVCAMPLPSRVDDGDTPED